MLYNSCTFSYAFFRSAPGKAAQGAVMGKSSVAQTWCIAAVTLVLDAFLLLEVLGRGHLSWAMGTVPLTLSWDATEGGKAGGRGGKWRVEDRHCPGTGGAAWPQGGGEALEEPGVRAWIAAQPASLLALKRDFQSSFRGVLPSRKALLGFIHIEDVLIANLPKPLLKIRLAAYLCLRRFHSSQQFLLFF